MSLYGNKEIARKVLAEREASNWHGLEMVNKCKSELESVQIYNTPEGEAYLSTSNLEQYMEAAEITDVVEAVNGLKEYYNLEKLTVCFDECSEEMYNTLWESKDITFEGCLEENKTTVTKVKNEGCCKKEVCKSEGCCKKEGCKSEGCKKEEVEEEGCKKEDK